MILWVLIGIFALFVLFAFLRGPIHKRFGFKVCSICVAVSLTWIALLILKFFGMLVDNLLLGILMGQSVASVMYLFENTVKKHGKNKLLALKVVIILLGTSLVYLFLTQGFSLWTIITIIISVIFAIIIWLKLKSKKKHVHKHGKFSEEIKKLEEKLENCCD